MVPSELLWTPDYAFAATAAVVRIGAEVGAHYSVTLLGDFSIEDPGV